MKAHNPTRAARLAIAAAALLGCISAAPRLHAQAAPERPVTAPDAKDYEAAEALFRAGKFTEAAESFEKFLGKYKMFSPRSLDAKFRLAVARVQLAQYEEAIRHLREVMANPKIDAAAREMAQLLVAKALTLKAVKMPSENPQQKAQQKKFYLEGIKEYDAFIAAYPKSRDMDSAQFLRATLLLQSEEYEEAVKGFGVVANLGNSPYLWEARMWIGKTHFIQAGRLLETKEGKEPSPENVKKAMALFDTATPWLTQAYQSSGDIALQNEAVFFVGQMQLTRSQHVDDADAAQQKKMREEMLNRALDAFRSVRSVEEVVAAQQAKIDAMEKQMDLLPKGTVEYLPLKNRLENLINFEEEKRDKFKGGQDQYLAARLAIARIFLFLKKPDEARTLVRFLLSNKELLEKDKDSQATIASLVCLTYAEQKNGEKAMEAYEAFRKDYKGTPLGENLPLLVADALVQKGMADAAEKVVAQGQADYKNWRFNTEAMQVLTSAALKKGEYAKALDLCQKVLDTKPKPETEAQMLFVKGSIQQAELREKGDASKADAALASYKALRDKYPNDPQSEDAWFNSCQILGGTDAKKAVEEINAYIAKFSAGGGKSPNTKDNLPSAHFLLGTALVKLGQNDKAVEAWKKLIETFPETDPAAGAYFKIFDVHNEKKDYAAAQKTMDEFLAKYPKHENVYYAYNNSAEMLFAGALDPKKGASTEAGVKKLLEYVDYEISSNLEHKRGDGALIKIADKWLKEMSSLPPFLTLNPAQRQTWQKGVDGVASAAERLLKDYPESERLAEILERLVAVQNQRRKAQQADGAQVEAYFKKLSEQFGKTPLVKAKLDIALAAFLYDADQRRAFTMMDAAFQAVPKSPTIKGPDGNIEVAATFAPADFDRYLAGLFEAKRNDEITKAVARLRLEYPLDQKADPSKAPKTVQDGQAVALFWEGKLLQEQGKTAEAGAKFSELKAKFSKSAKALEADYGVILGEFEQTKQVKDDYIERLGKIMNIRTGKGFELQARAMILVARMLEAKQDFDGAIEYYLKVQDRYASVPKVAADGLWKAAELAEKQAKNEPGFPVKTKQERKAAAEARAAEIKAKAATKTEEPKAGNTKSGDEKPADPKAAPAKPNPAPAPAGTQK